MKRYYIGARHIGEAVGRGVDSTTQRATLDEACAEAKRQVENGNADCVVVVQIVAVVRRQTPPVTVEILEG